MITLELTGVQYGIGKSEGGVALVFDDAQSGIKLVVPFDVAGWINFKRGVAADGEVTPIALAQSLADIQNGGGVRP